MNQKDVTKTTYTDNAEAYLHKFSQNGVREKEVEEVFSYYTTLNPFVIELGCAGGREAEIITRYTHRYIGIDYIPSFIETAQKTLPHATFLVEDIATYSFPEKTDIIFAFASLLHLDKEVLRSLFIRVHTSLTEGGLFRISLKYSDVYTQKDKKDTHGIRTFYYYDEATLLELADQFTVIFMRKENHLEEPWVELLLQKLF